MAVELYDNTFATTVGAGGITNVATTLPTAAAASTALQAAGQFRIIVESEIMLVTAGAATTSWTVARAQEGTTAVAHAAGVAVTHILTAQSLKNLIEGRNVVATSDGS